MYECDAKKLRYDSLSEKPTTPIYSDHRRHETDDVINEPKAGNPRIIRCSYSSKKAEICSHLDWLIRSRSCDFY